MDRAAGIAEIFGEKMVICENMRVISQPARVGLVENNPAMERRIASDDLGRLELSHIVDFTNHLSKL